MTGAELGREYRAALRRTRREDLAPLFAAGVSGRAIALVMPALTRVRVARGQALRCGVGEWLGAIEPQYLDPDPVHVWRTLLGWLRADCRGLVLLSRDRRDRYRVLSGLRTIAAEDLSHAAELRDILAWPWPAPRVIVGEARDAA